MAKTDFSPIHLITATALLLCLSAASTRAATTQPKPPQLVRTLDTGWRFHPDPRQTLKPQDVSRADFNDQSWFTLNALRQWQLQPDSLVAGYHGVAWYRKTFATPENPHHQHLLLYFSGSDGNAEIYLNGKKIGSHRTAGAEALYAGWNTPFHFDITDNLRPSHNILAVKVTSKPVQASGLHGGVSLWLADSDHDPFPSLLPNPYWANWASTPYGPMPAGWRLYAKADVKPHMKTARVKTPDGAEGLAVTLPAGNCNLFPGSVALDQPGVYHFSVQLTATKPTSLRARMYLPRPGEVTWQAKEFYGTTVKLKPNQPQWLRFDIPITEPGRANMLYLYLRHPEGLIISQPSLIWEKAKE